MICETFRTEDQEKEDVWLNCISYQPLQKTRRFEREDIYGYLHVFEDEVLVGEFCRRKGEYILSKRDCESCMRRSPARFDEMLLDAS